MIIKKLKKRYFSPKSAILRFKLVVGLVASVFIVELMFPHLVLAQTIKSEAPEAVLKASPRGLALNEEVIDYQVKNTFYMSATAYSSTPDQTDSTPFITASGSRVRDGVIATNFLPFGTKVRFPDYSGDKIYVVEDRMNARYWHRVDLWMSSRYQAIQFGTRYLKMEILK